MASSTALTRTGDAITYERHRPQHPPLYAVIEEHFPRFLERLETEGDSLPHFVLEEFEAYLKCGRLEQGFLRVKCEACRHEKLVAFSCKRRGFCPSCGARRMAETAAHLVDHVLPEQPIRQWVVSFPYRDADGYYWFMGRKDDVISSAGHRVGPGEIEDCLLKHPAVRQAAVVGSPDTLRGQRIKAFIVLAPGHAASDALVEDIQRSVRTRLAAHEYPRDVEFIDELPMTTTGKVRRIELREREIARKRGGG